MNEDNQAWVRSWPLLLVAALLMIGGAFGYYRADDNIASAALIGAGLIIVGTWIGMEVYRTARRDNRHGTPATLPSQIRQSVNYSGEQESAGETPED
jgi:hypothetical protein